jgi:hypothetical protein
VTKPVQDEAFVFVWLLISSSSNTRGGNISLGGRFFVLSKRFSIEQGLQMAVDSDDKPTDQRHLYV